MSILVEPSAKILVVLWFHQEEFSSWSIRFLSGVFLLQCIFFSKHVYLLLHSWKYPPTSNSVFHLQFILYYHLVYMGNIGIDKTFVPFNFYPMEGGGRGWQIIFGVWKMKEWLEIREEVISICIKLWWIKREFDTLPHFTLILRIMLNFPTEQPWD